MSIDRNAKKPSKGQIATIRILKGTMKGIKTYRDAENYIKRLRRAAKTKTASVARPVADGFSCKLRDQKMAKDKADRLPVIKNATDVQRVRLPKIDVKKVRKCSCGGSGKAKCVAKLDDHILIAKDVDTALKSLFDAVITLMNTVSFEIATENSK